MGKKIVKASKLEFASWIFLVISTVFIQIADWQVNDFQKSIDTRTIDAINLLQGYMSSKIQSEFSYLRSTYFDDSISEERKTKIINKIINKRNVPL